MVIAMYTSHRIFKFEKDNIKRVNKLLLLAKLPINSPEYMSTESYSSYMINDKKLFLKK